ncbi:MAG: DUF1893 domain-containing protein [Clostridia bacterium]|nr:DUF1893 domain-containing protein [Clostridia bacterium]
MCENLIFAKDELIRGGHTLVLWDGTKLISSSERGIKPLVKLFYTGRDFSPFSAADKVVGRAAAFMYSLLNVRSLYAEVVSEAAQGVLSASGIDVKYGKLVKNISNRTGDGICPMEKATLDITDANEALSAIEKKLAELGGTKK